ncbi:MAG: hypothetical protein HPY85_06760 [Anaerolineae bacterium]|nr:hypothetical protein [Anaerolineae bacterium]
MSKIDMTILDGFRWEDVWGVPQEQLTERQKLQCEVARLVYSVVDDVRRYVKTSSMLALLHAEAILPGRPMATTALNMVKAELRKRGRVRQALDGSRR